MSLMPDRLPLDGLVHQAHEGIVPSHLPIERGRLLDQVHDRLLQAGPRRSEVFAALDELFDGLRAHRFSMDEHAWQDWVQVCRSHPLRRLIHEDPFTERAYSKPRGYAGDAELLDFIYGCEEGWPPPATSALGQLVFQYTTSAPAADGVRARRAFIADLLDDLARTTDHPHVLSIAAGHLREAGMSAAVRRGKVGRYVALDSDAKSLQQVQLCYGRCGVQVVTAHIRRLLARRINLGQFDLVYSTGLFDYLEQPIAARLLSIMFAMLRRGGSAVVANFLPDIRDVGYMEAYMDWHLIYRTRHEMIALTSEIPEHQIQKIQLLPEENRNILFLEVQRS